jgi:hypothetical protein
MHCIISYLNFYPIVKALLKGVFISYMRYTNVNKSKSNQMFISGEQEQQHICHGMGNSWIL